MRHVIRTAVVLTAASALLLPAWGADAPKIRIGLVGPFSGTLASVGERIGNGARMATEERNAAGGVLGSQIELVVSDDEGDPQKSTIVAQRLVDDPTIAAVIGPMNSGAVLAAAPIYEQGGLAFISPAGTNPKITDSGWKAAFRTAGRDDREGPISAKFIVETLRPKTVFMIDDRTAFEKGIADEVEKVLKANGITVRREQISRDDKDLSSILTLIKTANLDLVYAAIEASQAALLTRQADGLGIRPRIMGNGSMRRPKEFIEAAGGTAEGAYVSLNARDPNRDPAAKAWAEKFAARYGTAPSGNEASAYDAARALFKAIEVVGQKGGRVDRAAVINTLHGLKDVKSIFGHDLTFDAKGDVPGVPVTIFQVKGGEFVEVARLQ